ncbi:ABC transporter permease [Natrarchaeobius halalkaliphilus]|uniref:ABC transporter permease n=1 Tax=Natrarchaeobius halalkaliphilus TaxID=1679091 RepID=A0A3N6LSF2_9EURY|nr:ABC transporter permease [Natrarchaeobius halalkaliphilus]RQG92853.1 ABC transporter permease [Natrarchaeobius halalkaliphilus]
MTRPEPTRRGRIRIEGFDERRTSDQLETDERTATGSSDSVERLRSAGWNSTETDRNPRVDSARSRLLNFRRGRRLEDVWRRFRSSRTALLGFVIVAGLSLVTIFARPIELSAVGYTLTVQPFSLAPYDPSAQYVGPSNAGPSLAHPFGTDWAGRDVLSRVLAGGRFSLSIGALAVALALCVGVPLGAIAGYFGGWVDETIMRLVDTLYAFPFLVLAIAVVAIFGQGYWNVVAALAVTGWLSYARLLRGEVLSIVDREYVDASKALGTPHRTILVRHVIPNAIAPVIVQATLNVGTVVLAAAALGFLGLGLEAGTAEWGTMLAGGRSSLLQGHWHITVFPGLAIFLFVLGTNLVGDGLSDALDPQSEFERRIR